MASARVYRYLVLLFAAFAVLAAACSDPVVTRLVLEPVPGHECPPPDPDTPPDPECVTIAKGESVIVHAFYERAGVREPVGTELNWMSNLPTIAQVTGGGSEIGIVGVDRGAAVITARVGMQLKNEIKVLVTAPDITTITIEPPSVNVPAGLQTQLVATARLVDGSTMPVTHLVTWASSDDTTATIDQTGEVTGHRPGNVNITATLDDLMAIGSVSVTQPRLTAITLAPANPSVPLGGTQQLAAMGTFTDGSMRDVSNTVTWSSAQPGVASVSIAGVVTGNVLGSTMISAQQSTVRGSTTVTVTAPVLASIAVTPVNPSVAAGQVRPFTATGTLTDGTTTNLTATATWTSTAMAVATISNAPGTQGRATSIAPGMTTIRATMGAISGETTLTVTPAVLASIAVAPGSVSVALGRTQQFTATGTLTNGVMMPMTTTVTWSSTTGAASVSNAAGSQGLATTLAVGPTQIVATSGTVSGSATLSVGAAVVQTITVVPADSSLAIGATRQMRAIAGMSDGTTPDITSMVTWGTSMPGRASITAAGVARGVSLGATTITATQGMVSGMTTLTVTPVELASITVTPPLPSVAAGQTQQFTATGRYTDDSTADLTATVTWSSGTPAVASISNQGLATTLAGGTSTITATMGMISGSATLTSNAVTVAGFSPADGAASIRAVTPISITFTQAMNPGSLFGQLAAGPCGGNLQLSRDDFQTCLPFTTVQPAMSAGNTVATLVPAAPLRALTRYRVRVTSSVMSSANIPMLADVTMANGFVVASDGPCAAELVISQVYGGGGNAGAPVLHDFIELHNPGPVAVDLGGKAIQYLSDTGTGAWSVQALPSVQIAPGGYFLVREAAGAGAQPPLANPDFTPMSPFAMSATAGKVALTATTTPLSGACPIGLTLDLVGYGPTASCFEGNAPVPAPDNATGVVRASAGCTDLGLETDFSVAAPSPRNGASAPSVCVCYVNETDLEAEVDTCTLTFPALANGPAGLTVAVFGRVFEAGVTEGAGAAPVVRMSFGFGVGDSSPMGWPWLDGIFNQAVGTNDEYRQQLTFPMAGDFDYTSRATRDGTNWTLCDIDGAGSVGQLRFDQFQTGAATITP